ncbi:MAG: SIR2 family protein [Chloroflexota bacterium]|nr:SIR2 family protein [Chloroflexota bacterium]
MLESLDPDQLPQFHAALLAAFPRQEALHRLVRAVLRENLESLVKANPLKDMVFDLIEWAEAQGKLTELIRGARDTNPDNPQIRAFIETLGWDFPVAATTAPAVILPEAGFERWRALLTDLESGLCVPILGPRLLEPLIGSSRDLARRWAQGFDFPWIPQAADDLPQVAQFLATVENPNTVRSEFRKYLTGQLLERYGDQRPLLDRKAPLDDLLRAVAATYWAAQPPDPHRLLAALPCPIYITANPDNLLTAALRAAGRAPQVELCRWLEDPRWPPSIYVREPDYQPTPARPLVYHLFGNLAQPFSLVLKEDDYFDYLVGVTRFEQEIPSAVLAAITDSALLFLGFRLDDWSFRVLFRSLLGPTTIQREQHPHVAVQLKPAGPQTPKPAEVYRYLQRYFASKDVTIYWGGVEQFLADFQTQWARYQSGEETI